MSTALRFELRPYQIDALDRTAAAEARGVRRQLGVAATGLGKTVMFCALAQQRGGRTLILAHRDELVSQAVAKVREVWPGVEVGIVKATDNDVRSQVVVASVQTLSRPSRLAQLAAPWHEDTLIGRADRFSMVVVDEAHHTAADTYRRIVEALDAGGDDGPLLLGVTATPDRGDGKGLDDLFDEIAWCYDLLWGIRAGYLSDVRAKRITLDALDLKDVKMSRGDFEAGSAGRAMEDADAPNLIVKSWLDLAAGRRTLCFTPTVALAEAVSDEFNLCGITSAWVSGQTPLDERRQILRSYAAGDIQVLANCAVLTEGYDEPRTDCIIVARPTKSRALYTQMVGRGTRRHPDKVDLLVLDVVGATTMHDLVTIPSLFGIDQPNYREQIGERPASEIVAEWEQRQITLGQLRAEDVELFARVRRTEIAWAKSLTEPGELRRYVKSLGRDSGGEYLPTVVLQERGEESWTAGLLYRDGSKQVLISSAPMEMAQGVAEDFIRRHGSEVLIATHAPWRLRKPSPRALAAAATWKLKVDPSWNAGQLSEALDAHIVSVRSRR